MKFSFIKWIQAKAGAPFKMFPPRALVLFRFALFLLCFPLGKLPLSFLRPVGTYM